MGVPDVDSTDAEAAASLSQDATETTTRTAGMAKYLKLYAVPEVEEAHGVAGRIVKRLGIFAYSLFFVIPLIFVAIIFAIVPIGDPLSKTMRQQWVFLFISNPAVMALFTFLYEATFLSVAERERPFRVSLIPMVLVIVLQMGLLVPLLLLNGVIDYLGILLLAIFFFALYIGCFIAYPLLRSKLSTFFRSFILLISLYLPILSAYIIGYREVGSSGGQAGLAIGLAFVTFVYRRIMLSRLDPFPLDLAQLLAGYVMLHYTCPGATRTRAVAIHLEDIHTASRARPIIPEQTLSRPHVFVLHGQCKRLACNLNRKYPIRLRRLTRLRSTFFALQPHFLPCIRSQFLGAESQ